MATRLHVSSLRSSTAAQQQRRQQQPLHTSLHSARPAVTAAPRRTRRTTVVSVRAEAPFLPNEAAAAAADPAAAPAAPPPVAAPPGSGYRNAVLLQGFAWDSWKNGEGNWYGKLQALVPDIAAAGFTHVWLPPPSRSVAAEGYLPGQLYDMSSKYGNKAQLQALTAALKAAGVTPVADIVINHRCADEKEGDVYNNFRDDHADDHGNTALDWGKWAITANDPVFGGTGNPDTGADFHAAPDLDHANPDLRAALTEWLSWLQTEMGFQGWRFDYVKGYGAGFIQQYVDGSVGAEVLNVGELWPDMRWDDGRMSYDQTPARQALADWVSGTGQRSCAFDFVTKAQLQEALRNTQLDRLRDSQGKASGLLGWWPSKTVTFIENHDTGSTQQHWPFPAEHVGAGYAYILTHPGIPCVFYDHFLTWGPELRAAIQSLLGLRRKHGIHADSQLDILAAEPDLYVARVDDRLVLKLGPRMDMGGLLPPEAEGWAIAASGKDWAVWERAAGAGAAPPAAAA